MVILSKRRGAALAGLLLALSIAAGTAMGAGEQIRRAAVVSSGGAYSAGSLRHHGGVGQPAVGAVRNGVMLCSGLHCGAGAPAAVEPPAGNRLYLPLTVR